MREPFKTYAQKRDDEQNRALQQLLNSYAQPVKKGQKKIEPGMTVWSLSEKKGPFTVIAPAEVKIGLQVGSNKSFRLRDGGVAVPGWWCRDSRGVDHPFPHHDLATKSPLSWKPFWFLTALLVVSSCLFLFLRNSGLSGFLISSGLTGGAAALIGWVYRILAIKKQISQTKEYFANDPDEDDTEVLHL